jgi:hypothetical protein
VAYYSFYLDFRKSSLILHHSGMCHPTLNIHPYFHIFYFIDLPAHLRIINYQSHHHINFRRLRNLNLFLAQYANYWKLVISNVNLLLHIRSQYNCHLKICQLLLLRTSNLGLVLSIV